MRAVTLLRTQRPSVLVLCALVTVPLAFALIAGPLVAVAGILPIVATIAVGPGVAIILAHLVAIVVLPEVGALELLLFEASLAPLIAAPRRDQSHRRDAAVAWIAAIGLGAVVVIADRTLAAQWLVAMTLLAVAGGTLYGIHRFELVTLDLVTDEEPEGAQ